MHGKAFITSTFGNTSFPFDGFKSIVINIYSPGLSFLLLLSITSRDHALIAAFRQFSLWIQELAAMMDQDEMKEYVEESW